MVRPAPSSTHLCLAFTTPDTEAMTGYGTLAARAGWTVVMMPDLTAAMSPLDTDSDSNTMVAKLPKVLPLDYPAVVNALADFSVWCDNKHSVNEVVVGAAVAAWPARAAVMLPKHHTKGLHGPASEIFESCSLFSRYRRHETRMWTYLDRHKEALVVNPAWEIWPSADMASSLITFDGWAATTVRRALALS